VHCTRLNQGQRSALSDEKIISQLRFTLIKLNARSRAGHFHLEDAVKGRDNSGL
jgi:hypothetical protein